MQLNRKLDSVYLKQNLRNKLIGSKFLFFNSVTSTNEVARKFASNRKYNGTVIIAETQTKGKGRKNRTWLSPAFKGLWFSVVLQPECPPENLGLLSLLASNAFRKAVIAVLKVNPQLKWPNDVFLNGKKISGILLESLFQGTKLNHVIIGMGVNVKQTSDDFPKEINSTASSLFTETGQNVQREILLLEILHQLEYDYLKFLAGDLDLILSEWDENCLHKDRQVELSTPNGERVSGKFQGVDALGNLCLLTPENNCSTFSSAEVRIIQRR